MKSDKYNILKYFVLMSLIIVVAHTLWAAPAKNRVPAQNNNIAPAPGAYPDDEFIDDSNLGNAPAGNPFVSSKGKSNDTMAADPYEEEDFDEMSDELLRQRMEERLRQKSGQMPAYTPPAQAEPRGAISSPPRERASTSPSSGSSAPLTISLSSNGEIQGKGPGCLRLDTDTGYGPDVVNNFDFPDADIVEIAKTLGKLTCTNFILDKDVRGRISIVSNAPITIGDAWKAFLTALDVNQLAIIPSGKYLRIAKQRDAKDKQLKIYAGAYAPDNDGMITRVIPLKYINAEEVRRVFMNITAPTTRMLAYDQTNTLIITDTAANIKKLTDLIALLDIEGFDESLQVVKIRHASAEEIAKLIDQLIPSAPGGVPGAPPGVPRFGSRSGFTQRKTKEGGVISHIIADARTNSLIVNANQKGFDQVKQLIKKLDTKVSLSQGGGRIHVVYLQYADAEQVSQTLNNLTSGSGTASSPIKPGVPGASTQTVLFEGAVKVAADKATNSLVVTASLSDFTLLKRVISKLDVARDQVYVETIIMEMSMDRGFAMSSSVVNPSSGIGFLPNNDLANFLMNPLTGVTGLALGFKHGSSVNITPPGGGSSVSVSSIQGLVTALQSNSNSNVLATPQILTLDNQEASIEIGETVPVPSVTAVQGAGTSQSFTREKVSLSLTIKPQINKISNFVKMDIKQKYADFNNRAVPKALQDQSFGTTERSSQTTVVVQDQDTVVLGGLIRDKVSESSTKVPILGDIPVLGWLFRAKSTQSSKTNLLVFITPRIIKHYQTIRTVLDKKLKERDEFLEENNGGNDPYEAQKLRMVRDLPPPEALKDSYKIEDASFEQNLSDGDEDEADNDDLGYIPQRTGRGAAFMPSTMPALPQSIPPSLQGIPSQSSMTVPNVTTTAESTQINPQQVAPATTTAPQTLEIQDPPGAVAIPTTPLGAPGVE